MKTTDLVKDWLSSEGYKCEIDEDGDLKFKYQGATLWVMADAKDPLFLRVSMPYIYEVDGDREKVVNALNVVNADMKVAKGFVLDNGAVWVAVEMYIDASPELEDFFERCLNILIAAREKFYNAYKEL